jgi:transcriptional regulator with XRE-family HTH domain
MSWQERHRPVSLLADMALRQERVAQRLAELRERHALSQEKAAQKVGITHRQWQRWENGQSMPRPGNLGEVALAFGVPVTTFYEEDDAPELDDDRLDEALGLLKQLLSRQEALAEAVASLVERLDADQKPSRPGRRQAS